MTGSRPVHLRFWRENKKRISYLKFKRPILPPGFQLGFGLFGCVGIEGDHKTFGSIGVIFELFRFDSRQHFRFLLSQPDARIGPKGRGARMPPFARRTPSALFESRGQSWPLPGRRGRTLFFTAVISRIIVVNNTVGFAAWSDIELRQPFWGRINGLIAAIVLCWRINKGNVLWGHLVFFGAWYTRMKPARKIKNFVKWLILNLKLCFLTETKSRDWYTHWHAWSPGKLFFH